MRGENFTGEFKFPIKLYKIWIFEFADGVEVRKLLFGGTVGFLMIVFFIYMGIHSSSNVLHFIKNNWLILLILFPSAITLLVFNIKYDNKPVLAFFRDRFLFYLTRNKEFEHFEEVITKQRDTEFSYEKFRKGGSVNI
ncbi:TcpE family protein (plasmid) [Paenibacillus larvae subsp. larvae]|uniref:TcpE family conjugal transfer membrane protein n=1 Tax=Paenibacillus larvae TaxID=1464 RepID=UPI0009C2FF1E|nr:TcpE family conjugal transfer membrane protein [Paenibacillus larvae]AQT87020.1 hypothetical protein B1222_23605 [Paenibacillus larvae subsp. pulvifaciens]AVF33363.1 TcpE family protein [Paenibacillus larvae subsp. larvae]MBH0342401.1 hypothetical protein [Paenibacillus larvae]MCY7518840.1 conjugal transfer protein [Paenibacillus larvae]MCY9500564.1 conjugal transfer protein [Paenibacillus larvae]